MSRNSVIAIKSREYAYRVVDMYKFLTTNMQEYVMSKQVLRAGTSIAANVAEAERGETKADFFHKLGIALKEANEMLLWLDLLRHGEYIDDKQFESMYQDCEELIRILVAIIKNRKGE